MATVLDLSLLKQFSEIFAWLLIFIVTFGILGVTKVFESRGINALIALAVTVLLSTTTGTTGVIRGMLPWFVLVAFFLMFMLVLANFVGIPSSDVLSAFAGSRGAVWWIFTALIIGLTISLVSGGQFSRGGETSINPVTGMEEVTAGKAVINIITEPKVLALIVMLSISAIAVALMAGAPKILH